MTGSSILTPWMTNLCAYCLAIDLKEMFKPHGRYSLLLKYSRKLYLKNGHYFIQLLILHYTYRASVNIYFEATRKSCLNDFHFFSVIKGATEYHFPPLEGKLLGQQKRKIKGGGEKQTTIHSFHKHSSYLNI